VFASEIHQNYTQNANCKPSPGAFAAPEKRLICIKMQKPQQLPFYHLSGWALTTATTTTTKTLSGIGIDQLLVKYTKNNKNSLRNHHQHHQHLSLNVMSELASNKKYKTSIET